MWPQQEGGSSRTDFIIIATVLCIVPVQFIVWYRFVKPGFDGKGKMNDLRAVKINEGISRHTVPAGVKILDVMLTQGIQTILFRG
jgi:hypothetical protein